MITVKDLRDFAKYHLKQPVSDHPEPETTLGVEPMGYDPRAFSEALEGRRGDVDVTMLERIPHRGERYPMYRVQTRQPDARRRLLVLSGVHGNEQAGLLAIPPWIDSLGERSELEGRLRVTVLTPVNPVGAAHNSRYNAGGYDINRDFNRFETPEARVVRDVIDDVRPDFIVSLHEGPQEAAFLFANHHVAEPLARRLLERLRESGARLAEKDYFGRKLPAPGYAPSSRITRALEELWVMTLGMRTTNAYAGERGIPEVTLETSWRSVDAQQRVDVHVSLLDAVVDELVRR